MDLAARTLTTLDWDAVRGALVDLTRTPMGAERARGLAPMAGRAQVLDAYALVEEITAAKLRSEVVPVDAVGDVRGELGRASRGMILEAWALIAVGRGLSGVLFLHDWLAERKTPKLLSFVRGIDVSGPAVSQLLHAFDADGTLSDRAWPKLAALRQQVLVLRARVHDTLASLLADDGWGDMLMERFVTERSGRLVVPVKMAHRRGLGIVHGTSASGETAFVEPGQTVELQNDLREAQDGLESETLRILGELSALVGSMAATGLAALEATGDLDLAVARAEMGLRWEGTVPEIGGGGVLRLRHARHPLLALRGVEAVGNDLALDDAQRCLVLTGPNAGGKTVALKTMGLCALLARSAIPIPAKHGSRVDIFDPILADIGDLQSVSADLSTFSGHLAVLREALAVAAPGALLLVDEVAVGTDPAQGAALAGAVVEALVDRGARVVITTHYPELKALADPRIAIAGMEFAEGKPTYRLVPNTATSSQGLVMAQRMGLPAAVIERANALLDAGAARLARLAEQLDLERDAVARTARQQEALDESLRSREGALRLRETKLAAQLAGERARMVEATKVKLKALEEDLRALVKSVHQTPSLRAANEALATLRGARGELDEGEEAAAMASHIPTVGERVWVSTVGQHGEVLAILGENAEVQVRAMKLRLPLNKLGAAKESAPAARKPEPGPKEPAPTGGGVAVRIASNTADVRGMRLEEAELEVERFVALLMGRGERFGYVLHGHGTGALKSGLRERLRGLRAVRAFRAGEASEGGDAFTVLEL